MACACRHPFLSWNTREKPSAKFVGTGHHSQTWWLVTNLSWGQVAPVMLWAIVRLIIHRTGWSPSAQGGSVGSNTGSIKHLLQKSRVFRLLQRDSSAFSNEKNQHVAKCLVYVAQVSCLSRPRQGNFYNLSFMPTLPPQILI